MVCGGCEIAPATRTHTDTHGRMITLIRAEVLVEVFK